MKHEVFKIIIQTLNYRCNNLEQLNSSIAICSMTSNLSVLFLVSTIIQGLMAAATEATENYNEWTGVKNKFTE